MRRSDAPCLYQHTANKSDINTGAADVFPCWCASPSRQTHVTTLASRFHHNAALRVHTLVTNVSLAVDCHEPVFLATFHSWVEL